MNNFSDDQVGDMSLHAEPLPLGGLGTLDDPFRPAAFEENIQQIAQMAQEKNVPMYCSFEGSLFRIHPNGDVEWSHNMPPLRDNISDIIQDSLRQWRERLSK
ncbi:MAG: hypothetical protein WCV62_06840 [Candidatus Peribacteraceae bacterium]